MNDVPQVATEVYSDPWERMCERLVGCSSYTYNIPRCLRVWRAGFARASCTFHVLMTSSNPLVHQTLLPAPSQPLTAQRFICGLTRITCGEEGFHGDPESEQTIRLLVPGSEMISYGARCNA